MDLIVYLVFLSIYSALIHFIAHYMGRKREIGYGNSIIWCLLLTPIIGILIIFCSRKIETSSE